MKSLLLSAWRYRFFIISSIKNELFTRFVRSGLGGLWMILNPLAQVLIFAFVLSSVLAAKLPGISNQYAYAIYLMAGTLGWSLFTEIVSRCLTMFIDNGNILKKLAFPRIALPHIVTGSALVNNILYYGERSSVGRVPDCDSGCRGFESHRSPNFLMTYVIIRCIKKIPL